MTRITEKHVSLDVRPEQYEAVGPCLLEAIKDVLGDAANEEIITSWGEGYWYLANILIGIKKAKAEQRRATPGNNIELDFVFVGELNQNLSAFYNS